jgi:hypothetical protein
VIYATASMESSSAENGGRGRRSRGPGMSARPSNSARIFDGAEVIPPGWTLRDVPVPPGYVAALAVESEAASMRVLPWSPSQGVSRGHQPRTARR